MLLVLLLVGIVRSCFVPNTTLSCNYANCGPFGDFQAGVNQRVGLQIINGSTTICLSSPCLSCDAYCTFNPGARFIADGHWTCSKDMNPDGTYPEGTTCTATSTCCMDCDGGEGYIYGEYGKAHISSQFTCTNGIFEEVAYCGAAQISWTIVAVMLVLFVFI